jgi:hypothetical protein
MNMQTLAKTPDGLGLLKILAAAIAVGITFSISASVVIVLLASTSSAYATSDDPPAAPWVYQGSLWIVQDDFPQTEIAIVSTNPNRALAIEHVATQDDVGNDELI